VLIYGSRGVDSDKERGKVTGENAALVDTWSLAEG